MKLGLRTATATLALLATGMIVPTLAQDEKAGKGPGTEGPPSAQTQPKTGDAAQPRAAQPDKDVTQSPTKDQAKSTEGRQREMDRSKSAQPQDRDSDRQKSAQPQDRDSDRQKSTQDRTRDTTKRSESPDQDKGGQRAAGQKREKDQPRRADSPQRDTEKDKRAAQGKDDPTRDKSKTAEQPKEPKQGERLKVSQQDRTKVRDRIRQTQVEKTRINVNVSVGTTIPRSVHLHPLPSAIVEIAPEYRGYRYIVLENETIVIVHPTTYVIVDYIPASSRGATLALSSDQKRLVYRTLSDRPRVNVRARLALGAEVPRGVELVVFPDDIVQRIPELRDYRYVVTDEGVLVVEPSSYEVELVISD